MRDEQLPLLEASIRQYGLRVDMADSQSLNRAGYGLYEKKDYAGAVRFFREAAYINPANVYPHYNLACSLSLLRDSIWADPEAEMGYFNAFYNYDYFLYEYNLYPAPASSYNTPGDELCRDEIYDHVTLTFLQDMSYLTKAPLDKDLSSIHNQLRFKLLLQNIQTGEGDRIYGIYYAPDTFTKAVFFMLDGRITQINVNTETDQVFFLIPHENVQNKKEYTFKELVTGYEYILRTFPDFYKQQWIYNKPSIRIHTIIMAIDFSKIPGYDVEIPKTYDFKYDDFIMPLEFDKDNAFTLPDTNSNQVRFIKLYSAPYNILFSDDPEKIDTFIRNKTIDINLLASMLLIYDRYSLLNWILTNMSSDIDMKNLVLTACLHGKNNFVESLEKGVYKVDMKQFFAESGDEILLHAMGSGNPSFFEKIYDSYYSLLSPSQKANFLNGTYRWSSLTHNSEMSRIEDRLQDGTYDNQ
jgi:hypothetical protein